MNSFKAEEISLASFGHLIAYAKLFSSFFRHIIFSHMSHLGNFAVFMTLLGMLSISQAMWIEDVSPHLNTVIQTNLIFVF